MRILIWFHRDLRTHDHQALFWALGNGHEVKGIVFSPSAQSSDAKMKFWKETVEDLKANLATAGVSMVIGQKDPAQQIPEFVVSEKIDRVITHRRMNDRDQKELLQVKKQLLVELVEIGDLTLFDSKIASELDLAKLKPFTRFKNHAMENWKVPDIFPRPPQIEMTLQDPKDWSAGGESNGLMHLKKYVWESEACRHYHQTRNGMIRVQDSSKLSRWLAWGALSPRFIFEELQRFDDPAKPCPGVAALIYELVWRDYFKFLASVMAESFFSKQGLQKDPLHFKNDDDLFEAWCQGETGQDFIDANMRELRRTGWMSNRGRQNVASYLAKSAQLDWTLGAKWFEQQLVDDDTENNWGNWQYLAGVGTDPRNRQFDWIRQAAVYDPEGLYQKLWLGRTQELEEMILKKLRERSMESTICPSDVLAPEEKANKILMEEVRSAARRLCGKGLIWFLQKGEQINPWQAKGPIRLKLVGR